MSKFARLINQPKAIRTANLWATIFWIGCIIPTVLIWRESILWVAFLSIWANVISHYTAYLSARVEVRAEHVEQQEAAIVEELENPPVSRF